MIVGLKNSNTQFGLLAKALHWSVAIGIFTLLYLGIEQSGMERGDAKSYLRFVHASVATVVLFLMTTRIVWRFMNKTPEHPAAMPAWQRLSASAVHWGLYIAVFVQLTAGAMVLGTAGRGLPLFGFTQLPLPVTENRENHEWWEGVHEFVWKPLAVLIALHVLGALYNHFVAKNDVVRRMTVGIR